MTSYTQAQVDISIAIGKRRERLLEIDQEIYELVQEGRRQDMSWAKLGIALNTSGQAAWERYGLTDTQRAERSLQNRPQPLQDALEGLEPTRADRVAARKIALEKKRRKHPTN
jgi:hypothetical protein